MLHVLCFALIPAAKQSTNANTGRGTVISRSRENLQLPEYVPDLIDCALEFAVRPHLGLPSELSEESPEFFTGAGASLRGCRGHFRKGFSRTPGIREKGSPGTGDSKLRQLPYSLEPSSG